MSAIGGQLHNDGAPLKSAFFFKLKLFLEHILLYVMVPKSPTYWVCNVRRRAGLREAKTAGL